MLYKTIKTCLFLTTLIIGSYACGGPDRITFPAGVSPDGESPDADEEVIPEKNPIWDISPSELTDCALSDEEISPQATILPSYRLSFDSADELLAAENKIKIFNAAGESISGSDTIKAMMNFPEGRRGQSLRMVDGVLGLPLKQVVNPTHGGISLWVKQLQGYGQSERGMLLMTTDLTPGTKLSLQTHPVTTSLLQFQFKNIYHADKNDHVLLHSIANWAPDQWHHVALAWNEKSVAMYVDGRLQDAKDRWPNFPTSLDEQSLLYLGSHYQDGKDITGADGNLIFDELQFFDQSLAEDDVINLFTDGLDHRGPLFISDNLKIKLLGAEDGFGLDTIHGMEKKTAKAASRQLWQLRFYNKEFQKTLVFDNTALQHAQVTCSYHDQSKSTKLVWDHMLLPQPENWLLSTDDVSVAVWLTPKPDENEVQIYLGVENNSSQWILRSASLRVGGLQFPNDPNLPTRLLVPSGYIGREISDPFKQKFNPAQWDNLGRYPSVTMSMQFFGLISPIHESLYFGEHDPWGWSKAFNYTNTHPHAMMEKSRDLGLDVETLRYIDNAHTPGNDFYQHWPFVISLVHGDWFELASRYRKFALTAPWTARGPLVTRADAPTSLLQAGYMSVSGFATASHLNDALPQYIREQSALFAEEELTGLVFWDARLWQQANHCHENQGTQMNDNPRALPTKGFADLFDRAKEKNMPVAFYHNPTEWDAFQDCPTDGEPLLWSEANGLGSVIRAYDGSCYDVNMQPGAPCLPPDDLPTNKDQGYYILRMCPFAKNWQEFNKKLTDYWFGHYPIDGLYLDVVSTGNPRICYATDHGHPPGGGVHYAQGYKQLLSKIKQAAKKYHAGPALYSEGFADFYLDTLDGHYMYAFLDPHNSVPLAIAIYHDYTQFLTRPIDLKLLPFPSQVAMQGQFFSWGGMPGQLLNGDITTKEYSAIKNYEMTLAALRQHFRNYLVFGRMGPPLVAGKALENISGTAAIGVDQLQGKPMTPITLPYYEGDKFTVLPVALTSWISPQGKKGLLVTSLDAKNAHVIYVDARSNPTAMPGQAEQIRFLSLSEDTIINTGNKPVLRLEVNPLEIFLLEY